MTHFFKYEFYSDMNKCGLLRRVALSIVLAFLILVHSACAKSGSEELLKNISDGSVKYYKMLERGATKPDSDAMTPELHIDGSRFDLQFKKFSSYAGAGEFTISGNIMTASTNDGLYIFVFTVTDEGNLVFDAEESRKASSETDFGDLYDGAVFMPVFSAIRIKEADYEKKVRNTNFIFGYIWDFAE